MEIPLNQSTTKLVRTVKALIEKTRKGRGPDDNRKNKAIPSAQFAMTEGSEPKQRAVREMLTVYRDIHLKNAKLNSRQLLEVTHKHYKSRKQKRWATIPHALTVADTTNPESWRTAERNLRRYIQKAEKVMFNVANGSFPGKY